MRPLRAREGASARALEFLILTAARTGEVIGGRAREVDVKSRMWTIPPSRTKSGREHRVPLSKRALEIVTACGRLAPDAFLFSALDGKPLSNMAMLELLRGMGHADIVVHGFRSSFKDWAAETTGHENIVTEMALAHVVADGAEAAYRRGDLMLKRRTLMDDWADYCSRVREGKVIRFRRRRAS
jgi:integrase